MRSIIQFSMKNSVALFLVIIMLIGGGALAAKEMNIEKYPGVDIPYLAVWIAYPGASPEQALKDIGEPIEKEFMNIKGVKNVYTDATAWGVWVTLEFDMKMSMDEGEEKARTALAKIKLPDTALQPEFNRQSPSSMPIFSAGISSKGDMRDVQNFIKDTVVPTIEGIDGVSKVETHGIDDIKMYVRVIPSKLEEYQLTLDQVKQSILGNHLSIPTGEVTVDEEILPVRVSKELSSVKDVEEIKVLTASGPVPLKELAEVEEGVEGGKGYTRVNTVDAITFEVTAESGANTVAIVEEVTKKLDSFSLPENSKVHILSDQSQSINDSVSAMLREAILGALMAVLVTMLFLRNIRATVIAIISIPLSIFASIMVLKWLGYTLNIMTLAGIAVAVGRVVDDSIVVIENVFRRIRATKDRDSQLVEDSTYEVASAITSSTITTVAVFLPMAFVPGIVGRFFAPLAWTIVISLIFSLVVAITVVPLLSRLFLLKLQPKEHRENSLQKLYRNTLKWTLSHRAITLGTAVVLLISSVALIAPKLGTTFLPQESLLEYNASITMKEGVNSEKTNEVATEVEKILIEDSGIKTVSTSVGEGNANLSFTINNSVEDIDQLVSKLRNQFSHVSGAEKITVTSTGDMTGGGQSYLQIVVNGPNIKDIEAGSEKMVAALKDIDGLEEVMTTLEGDKPEIQIDLDEKKLADNGLMPAMVASSLRTILSGDTLTKLQVDNTTMDLQLTLKMNEIDSIDQLGKQKITNAFGQQIALEEVGTLKRVNSRMAINHLNGKEYVFVRGTITDSKTGEVSKSAYEALEKVDLPKGVSWYKEGASAAMDEGFKNMAIAIAVSVLLVYLVMIVAFGEGKAPFVILFSIPFSVIGALVGLLVVNEPIGMPAMIGLLMLNGIVVTNAIVLLDRVKKNEAKGLDKHEALIEAGVIRVRPILMTAIATVGALIPMAISAHAGLVSKSLAVVVIGGLSTSTLLTLIIVPVMYSLLSRGKNKDKTQGIHEVA